MPVTKEKAEEKPEETVEEPVSEKEETPEETPEEGISDKLVSFIEDKIKEVVATLTPKSTGRRSYRDEEESMSSLVEDKVKELLDKEKAAGEKHPEPSEAKAPPEPVPAAKPERRLEKIMGWS